MRLPPVKPSTAPLLPRRRRRRHSFVLLLLLLIQITAPLTLHTIKHESVQRKISLPAGAIDRDMYVYVCVVVEVGGEFYLFEGHLQEMVA